MSAPLIGLELPEAVEVCRRKLASRTVTLVELPGIVSAEASGKDTGILVREKPAGLGTPYADAVPVAELR